MLTAEGVSVDFGGVHAVRDVSLEVGDTEIVGLIGPNGSGKTSFMNALSGVVRAQGSVRVAGDPVPLGRPERARRAGLMRMFQAPQTYPALSCLQNVLLASADRRYRGLSGSWLLRMPMKRHELQRTDRALAALDTVGLHGRADQPAAALTYGEQRLLDLARAIAGEPRLLMLDEPCAGLNEEESSDVGRRLLEIRQSGVPVLVIDHKIDFIDAISDRIVVLDQGSVIAAGRPRDVWSHHDVMNAYLGTAGADA